MTGQPSTPVLNRRELTAISALIAYAAMTSRLSESVIQAMFTTAFNVPSVKETPSAKYDDAVRFLVDGDFRLSVN